MDCSIHNRFQVLACVGVCQNFQNFVRSVCQFVEFVQHPVHVKGSFSAANHLGRVQRSDRGLCFRLASLPGIFAALRAVALNRPPPPFRDWPARLRSCSPPIRSSPSRGRSPLLFAMVTARGKGAGPFVHDTAPLARARARNSSVKACFPLSGSCLCQEDWLHSLCATRLELRREVYPSALIAILAHASASLSAS